MIRACSSRSGLALSIAAGLAWAGLADQPAPHPEEGSSKPGPARVSLYFRDAPLDLLLDYHADLVGKTILRAPGMQATISLRTQDKVTAQEAADLIEGYLVMHNIALVEYGDALKAVPATGVHSETATIVDYDASPPRDAAKGVMTRRFRLKTLTVIEAMQVLTPLKHAVGVIQPIEPMKALLVTDTAPNLRKMKALLDEMDAAAASGRGAKR